MIYVSIVFILFAGTIAILLYRANNIPTPKIDQTLIDHHVLTSTDSRTTCGKGIRLNNPYGFYETYTCGDPFERAYCMGMVLQDLKFEHESNFVASIRELVPSKIKTYLLKIFIGVLNRNLHHYFKQEYKEELYALSLSSNPKFNYIASPYQRILNYHAAHDIGHTLQNYGLVGCSSFVVRNGKSTDGQLLLARNLDFSPSEDFNKLKVLYFIKPSRGYRFVSYSWPGFIGVISGMNEHGLCVVLHATKSKVQPSIGTPVSIIAREILQDAANISEARAILKKRKSFVSELFLVCSKQDKSAVVFEKDLHAVNEYQMENDLLICTNHLLSEASKNLPENIEWQNTISSAYRTKRLKELIGKYPNISTVDSVKILRDVRGLNDENIGLQNENAINQLAAHHGIIFEPEKGKFWVSANPYMMGEFVAYDFDESFKKFEDNSFNERTVSYSSLPKDRFLESDEYHEFLNYKMRKRMLQNACKTKSKLHEEDVKAFEDSNPLLFATHELLGDYFLSIKAYQRGKSAYAKALTLNIPTLFDQKRIEKKWNKA
jgi:predicted choloylglycine hydrolase